MSSKKSLRLNLLYERLKNTSGVSFDDLAREFEVSKKTIARDFKALQSRGAYKNGQLLCLDERLEKRLEKANSAWFNLNEPFLVQLFVDKKIAKYFKRKDLKGVILYPQSDESVILELEISHIMQIKPLIYEFIPYIKVLEPAWLNEKLKNELLEFVKGL